MIVNSLDKIRADTFQWFPDWGLGYYPVKNPAAPYDNAYFDRFAAAGDTKIGQQLNTFRVGLVRDFVGDGPVLDIGIGAGTFLELHGNCWGFDVNPKGIRFLRNRNRFVNPMEENIDAFRAITLFDSFEHIAEPWLLLDRIKYQTVFMSLPIFHGLSHVQSSKHFRPDEHFWHFTENGLTLFMQHHGFANVGRYDQETQFGREDILTFVFMRHEHAEQPYFSSGA